MGIQQFAWSAIMASKTSAADVLAGFPGPLTPHPPLKKWGLIFAGCAVFAITGEAMIRNGALTGWFVLIFFGLGMRVGAVAMLPGAAALTLDATGFEVTSFYRRSRTRWQDATGFIAARILPARLRSVLFNDAGHTGTLSMINAAFAGRNGAFPDTYGLPAEDLAQLMAQWRERAAGTVGFVG
jgi:hypothetical protein